MDNTFIITTTTIDLHLRQGVKDNLNVVRRSLLVTGGHDECLELLVTLIQPLPLFVALRSLDPYPRQVQWLAIA